MDTISMLLTGWIIFFFCSLALLKYIYIRFLNKKSLPTTTSTSSSAAPVTLPGTSQLSPVTSEPAVIQKSATKLQSSTFGTGIPRSQGIHKNLNQESANSADGLPHCCNGPDKSVANYISTCYHWLYSPEAKMNKEWVQVKDTFLDVINKTLRDSKKDSTVFVSVVDISLSDDITLTNLFAECHHTNNIKITCDCEAKLQGVLSLYSAEEGSRNCEFFVDRLSGRLNILVDCDEDLAIIKFDGWPEICFGVKASAASPTGKHPSRPDPKLIEELADRVTAAIRNVVLEVELKRFQNPSFPKHAVVFSPAAQKPKERYLLLELMGGKDIGLQKGCDEPYCVVEIDDPPQKFQTTTHKSSDPQWNETFVFNILPGGGEILFEVYDRVGTRFLGCHIISVDELNTEANHALQLKSRRMEMSEQITGALDVQFTFLDEKEYLQKSPQMKRILANGIAKPGVRAPSRSQGQVEISSLSDGPLDSSGTGGNESQNTLIIHPPRRGSFNNQLIRPIVKIERKANGYYFELGEVNGVGVQSKLEHRKSNPNPIEESETGLEGQYGEERGRRRTRRGDIFTSIRRRFSKGRSRSAAGPEDESGETINGKDELFNRSVSVDRKSLNSANQLNALGMGSARSSASELSGLSSYSTTTFIHENSTLVIECVENRVKKYFLVPPHLAETGKWRKRGKKLHIYNDHTFVAKHIAGGTSCAVCSGRFAFSLGKQGYRCRDCKLICHKECHVRVPSFCPNTSVYDIELGTRKSDPNATKTAVDPIILNGDPKNSTTSAPRSPNSTTTSTPLPPPTNNVTVVCVTTNDNNTKPATVNLPTKKRSKLSIFRKVTKLGKISEENLNSGSEAQSQQQQQPKPEETHPPPLAESTLIESIESH